MRFETIPAAETRQIDGPFFGVRVLDKGTGALLTVNRIAYPLTVLPTYAGEIDTVIATGPITLVLADSEEEDVSKVSATAAPPILPTVYGLLRKDVFVSAPGQVFSNNLASVWRGAQAQPPAGANALAIWTICGNYVTAGGSFGAFIYEYGTRSYFDTTGDLPLHGTTGGPVIAPGASGAALYAMRNLFAWFGKYAQSTIGMVQGITYMQPFIPPAGVILEVFGGQLQAGQTLQIEFHWMNLQ